MTQDELIYELNNRIGFETDNERYAMSETERDFYKSILNILEKEPCEDCVNREQAINEIEEWANGFEDGEYFSGKSVADAIRACSGIVAELPPVTPQPKTGEWIKEHHTIKCSNCNTIVFTSCDYNDRQEYREMVMDDYIEQYRYCPFCGRRMNGGNEK